jgi:excisionase family DNA binding protein
MSAHPKYDLEEERLTQLATEVSNILLRRLKDGKANEITKLLQCVFLTTDETAALLGVSPRTIMNYVQNNNIPVRYVNKERRFLLAELLAWSLPEDDCHAAYRLTSPVVVNLRNTD